MADLITRRRIIFFLFAAAFVTLSVFFFGRIIPFYSKYPPHQSEEKLQTNDCYLTEPADTLTLCQKCTPYERRTYGKACSATGYKELVLCSKSNIQTVRSCLVPLAVQRKHFWLFESVTFILGILAIASVQSRQKNLDKQMAEKIKRQIGESDE